MEMPPSDRDIVARKRGPDVTLSSVNFRNQSIALIERLASLGSKLPELEFHKQFARMHAQPGRQLEDVEQRRITFTSFDIG